MNTSLSEIFEENAVAYYKGLSQALGGKFIEQDLLIWFSTGRKSLLRFNGVLRMQNPLGADLSAIVDPILDYFRSNDLPFFWVDWSLNGGAPDLGSYLHSKGCRLLVANMPAMSRRLENVPEVQLPDEVKIIEIRSDGEQADWLDVLMEGFDELEQARPDFEQYLRNSVAEPQPIFRHYLAYWQESPCAISTQLCAKHSAGIYHVATLPAYRRRGLGEALTLTVMQAAQVMGCSTAVLAATPSGYPLYQRLGFEVTSYADLYTEISNGYTLEG